MRLARCIYQGQAMVGIVHDERIILPALAPDRPIGLDSMLAIIDGGQLARRRLDDFVASAGARYSVSLADVVVTAPIPRPRKNIMCLGWNYAEHVAESAAATGKSVERPQHPIVFTKAVTTVTGPYDDVPLDPRATHQLDWEVELGVVIGSSGRHIAEANALSHVFGYCVINDLSARDVQFRHKQYFLGKSLDGSCPMGPWLVTADEIPDPQRLALYSRVNGEAMQSANTAQMIFPVAQIIAILSTYLTLEPGDIIATGTPSGVGFARNPPRFLTAGDVVECKIEGIGMLVNQIVLSG